MPVAVSVYVTAHYPSWGSETRRVGHGPGRRPYVRLLITPHGDRKPTPTTALTETGRCSHYPSWGSETYTAALADLAAVVSLPLMGIGNPAAAAAGRRDSAAHYPSWGSETRYAPQIPGGGAPADLITPHGDRKLIVPPMSTYPPSSLPLMGIGTWSAPCQPPRGRALITPHGDRKRGGRGAGRTLRSARTRLITPHGDRKLAVAAVASQRRAAHYPSWGSETRCARPPRW